MKEVFWSVEDSPIPKLGEVIENAFGEKFKIMKREKGWMLSMEKVE